jgi:hypothetical protein
MPGLVRGSTLETNSDSPFHNLAPYESDFSSPDLVRAHFISSCPVGAPQHAPLGQAPSDAKSLSETPGLRAMIFYLPWPGATIGSIAGPVQARITSVSTVGRSRIA